MSGVVLVTGASGFIGSHICANLLMKGKNVRAAVRSLDDSERVEHLKNLEIEDGGSLELVLMDLFDYDSVAAAVAGCSDVIHAAAVLHVGKMDKQKEVVDPSIIGTQNLCSAIDSAGCVERLVHTSSTAAIRPTMYENGRHFTSDDWADDRVLELDDNAYGLAKTSAERIVRDWHAKSDSDNRPRLVTIHPCVTLGPPLSRRHLAGSLSYVEALVKRTLPKSLPVHINIVDVRDVAEAHVRALSGGRDEGRYLVIGGDLWMKDMANVLGDTYPDRKWAKGVLPYWVCLIVALVHPKITLKWARSTLRKSCTFSAEPAKEELGMTFRSPVESIVDSVPPMLERGWV